jgi:hypothetical protein
MLALNFFDRLLNPILLEYMYLKKEPETRELTNLVNLRT